MDVGENLLNVSDKHIALPVIKTLVPYAEEGGGYFFSVGKSIHNWSNISHNYTIVVKNNVEVITSFFHLSTNKLIVSSKSLVSLYLRMPGNEMFTLTKRLVCNQKENDRLTLSNCAQTTPSHLGPVTIDLSETAVYYAYGSTIHKMYNTSAPYLTELIELDKSLGNVTSMALNEDYSYLFTIQKCDSTQTISTFDSASLQPVRSTQLVEYPDEILQAVPLGNGVLLCRNNKHHLALVNTCTGQYSSVREGTTHLPCDSSECVENPMKLRDLTGYNNFQGQGVDLYGMDMTKSPIALKYNSKYHYKLIDSGRFFIGIGNWTRFRLRHRKFTTLIALRLVAVACFLQLRDSMIVTPS